jgi:hypothetical protein
LDEGIEGEDSTNGEEANSRELSLLELDRICHEAHTLIVEYRKVLKSRFPEGGLKPLSPEMSEMRLEFYRLSDWLIDVIANVHLLVSAHEGEVAYREAVDILQNDTLAGDLAALARGERFPRLPMELQDLFERAATLHLHIREATQGF